MKYYMYSNANGQEWVIQKLMSFTGKTDLSDALGHV